MKANGIIFSVIVIIFVSLSAIAWEGDTHKGITTQAESQESILQNYLLNLGFKSNAAFIMDPFNLPMPSDFKTRYIREQENGTMENIIDYPKLYARDALEWLNFGASDEDSPLSRARHHFDDPTTGEGWDEQEECGALLKYAGRWKTGDANFECWGHPAQGRALWDVEMEFTWPKTREFQLKALTAKTKEERSHYWVLTLFGVGTIAHLLEDMSVPEHTRNDWVYGHIKVRISRFPKTWH